MKLAFELLNFAIAGGCERGGRRRASKDTSGQHCNFPKSSHKPHRICGVCGDRARSLHFGGLSCDSCKAFFRRAVQSGTYKNFQCPQQPTGKIFILILYDLNKTNQFFHSHRLGQILRHHGGIEEELPEVSI
jgi:Zinc finger, C4 type (two domains)